jgi:nicotinamidase-related amidase
MVEIRNIDGVPTAVIDVIIDAQNGFLNPTLSKTDGGSLYVPDGEAIVESIGNIVATTQNGTFILSQDYHPGTHISFMDNHPGVVEYRKAALAASGGNPDDYLSPLAMQFSEIVLDKDGYIIGLKEADGRVRNVVVETSGGGDPSEEDRGRVTKVLDTYNDKTFNEIAGASTQTLWPDHCTQGKASSLFPKGLNLPEGLTKKIDQDLMTPIIAHHDAATGNSYYVVRKGMRTEVDSYGIGVENDRETETPAREVFAKLAKEFKEKGVKKVVFNIGGLASNFCVEFSANNVADFLAGHFKMRGMQTEINYVPDISRGIPIPGGKDDPFSLNGVPERLAETRDIASVPLAKILKDRKPDVTEIAGDMSTAGGQDLKVARG